VRIDFEKWAAMKPTIPGGLLPVMQIDDGPILTQSDALLRLIARKYCPSLYPEANVYAIDEAMGIVDDMRFGWDPCQFLPYMCTVFGHPQELADSEQGEALMEKMKANWITNELPKFANRIAEMLKKNGGWFATADGPTIADCKLVPFLRTFAGAFEEIPADTLDDYPALTDYIHRFCSLEPVKGWDQELNNLVAGRT
jgi:prostaglandin-H2 D-isomerase / glutathione transferase